MKTILSSIRAMLGDDQLRTHMAERLPLHIPAGGSITPSTILTLAELEQALARGAVPPAHVRIFGAYNQLDLAKAGVVKNDRLRPLSLQSLARQGATIVVNHAQNIFPALWDLACEAERWLGVTVTLAAVASFGRSGIELHYDSGDLIVTQLEGSKTWSFFGEPIRGSGRRFCSHDSGLPTEISSEATMHPGDVMFVPSGLFHRCTPSAFSLHLGMILTHSSGEDFVKHLAGIAIEEAKSSDPFQSFLGPDRIVAQAQALKARMIAQIESADPVQWLAERQAEQGRVRAIALRPDADRSSSGLAVLNMSNGPVLGTDGRYRASGAAIDWTPVIEAVIGILSEGAQRIDAVVSALAPPHSANEVKTALDRLMAAGLVSID
jgi:hypothetical protein